MWNKDLMDLLDYVGTNTLIHVSVDNLRLYEDLFISCEHLYALKNGHMFEPKLIRRQAYNIIRSFYNIKEDGLKDIYANLEDRYRPQYLSIINNHIKDYKIIEFNDYKLSIINKLEELLKNEEVVIITKVDFQNLKLKKILEYLKIEEQSSSSSDTPTYLIKKDKYVDIELNNDYKGLVYSYNELEDLSFNCYYKR